MGSMDQFSLSDLVLEKLNNLEQEKARKEQEYWYNRQQEDMSARLKQQLLEQKQAEDRAAQGIVPYLDPYTATRMNVTNVAGSSRSSDADSMWGLNPVNTGYNIGLRADNRGNIAEHGTYGSAGAQDQLAQQRLYFGMLRGLFPKDINPAYLTDEELSRYVPNQMLFDIGREAENKVRSAQQAGFLPGETPQVDVSYDPNSLKHLGDERLRGSAINSRTGVNIYDVVNLPEYNVNWFSDDPQQAAVRAAYEKEHGTDYSRFQNYNKSKVIPTADGKYTVVDLHQGAIKEGLSIDQAINYQDQIEAKSGTLDKARYVGPDAFIEDTNSALGAAVNTALTAEEKLTGAIGWAAKAPSGLLEQAKLDAIPEVIRNTVLNNDQAQTQLKALKAEQQRIKGKDWINQGYKDYLDTEITKAEHVLTFTDKKLSDFLSTGNLGWKNTVAKQIDSYLAQKAATNVIDETIQRAQSYFGVNKEFTSSFMTSVANNAEKAGQAWEKGNYGTAIGTAVEGIISATLNNPAEAAQVAIGDLLPTTIVLATGGAPALTAFAADLNNQANRTYQEKYHKAPTAGEQAKIAALSTVNAFLDRLSDKYILGIDNAAAKTLIQKINKLAAPLVEKTPELARKSAATVAKLTNLVAGKPLAEGLQEATQSVMEDYAGTLSTASIRPEKAALEGSLGILGGATAGPIQSTGRVTKDIGKATVKGVTEAIISAGSGTTEEQRIEKLLSIPEYVSLSTAEETKLVDRLTRFEEALLNPNITEKRKQDLQTKIDEINNLIDQGKVNPKGLSTTQRANLEKRLAYLKQASEVKIPTPTNVKPAGEAAPAAESAAVTEATEKLVEIARNNRLAAEERQAAASNLATKVSQDQSPETAQAVIDTYEQSKINQKTGEDKLASLANIIDAADTVDPEQLTDDELKDVHKLIKEFNASNAASRLEEAASDVTTGASPVSSNILNSSKDNFKSIKEHFADLVGAIKNRDIAKVKNIAMNLQKFRTSETGKARAVRQAIRELKSAQNGAAILITRSIDPTSKVPVYTLERTTVDKAKAAQKEFKDKTDKEGKNVFFVAKGKISEKFTKAIEIESEFVTQAHEVANTLISVAEELETNKTISETLENAVTTSSNILNKYIPETTTQETKDGKEKVQEERKQEKPKQEDVKPKEEAKSPPTDVIPLREIILDNYDKNKDLPASTIKRIFDKRIKVFQAVADRIRKGLC